MDSNERILDAAKSLFEEEGYQAVKTKEIAKKAKVNEVTIFRNFGTKQKLFKAVFDKYYYEPRVAELEDLVKLDKKTFLKSIGLSLYEALTQNSFMLISALRKESDEINEIFNDYPSELRNKMIQYMMQQSNEDLKTLEIKCTNFINSIFGYFVCTQILYGPNSIPHFDECLEEIIQSF